MASILCALPAVVAAGKPADKRAEDQPVEKLVPGRIAGWKVDAKHPATAGKVKTARSKQEAEDLIDGSAEPFYAPPFSARAMAWQNYVKGKYQAELFLWQMGSAAEAQKLWPALLEDSLYGAATWDKAGLANADDARVSNTGTTWWINVRKGARYFELKVQPSCEDDQAGKAAAIELAAALARKL